MRSQPLEAGDSSGVISHYFQKRKGNGIFPFIPGQLLDTKIYMGSPGIGHYFLCWLLLFQPPWRGLRALAGPGTAAVPVEL